MLYWDFNAPNIPNEKKDTSATAIAASAFLELSTLVSDPNDKEKYFKAGEKMLKSLCLPPYLAEQTESLAILLQMVHSRGDSHDPEIYSFSYGEYYFVEALMRYRNLLSYSHI